MSDQAHGLQLVGRLGRAYFINKKTSIRLRREELDVGRIFSTIKIRGFFKDDDGVKINFDKYWNFYA